MRRLTSLLLLLPSSVLARGGDGASRRPCASSRVPAALGGNSLRVKNNLLCLHGNLPPSSIRQTYTFSTPSEAGIIAIINI